MTDVCPPPHDRKPTDVRIKSVQTHFLPVQMRMPLKFGPESVTSVTCLRVAVEVENGMGESAIGWGETPLSVTWAWPSASMTYAERYGAMTEFCGQLAVAWQDNPVIGHALEIGHAFLDQTLPEMLESFNADRGERAMPHLAALIASSAFDIATHDAYGVLNRVDIYDTYNAEYLNKDLSHYLTAESNSDVSFSNKYPVDFLIQDAPQSLAVWHLVGGLDPIEDCDRNGSEPDDGYPVTLRQWIQADGLRCLKIKLRGNDASWDFDRIVRVGRMAIELGVTDLSTDFNCTAETTGYVNQILDRLKSEYPEISDRVLYVEQPFPYDLEKHQIDTHSVSERKPLFLDEERARLAIRRPRETTRLDRCGTQDVQDANRCTAESVLGQSTRHAVDGARPDQSDAGSNSSCPFGGARGNHHGCGIQRDAVLSGGIRARAIDPSGNLPETRRSIGFVDDSRTRFWISNR